MLVACGWASGHVSVSKKGQAFYYYLKISCVEALAGWMAG